MLLTRYIAAMRKPWFVSLGWHYVKASRILIADNVRSLRYSAPLEKFGFVKADKVKLKCMLQKDLHRIEKGLSLKMARIPFGLDLDERVSNILNNSVAPQIDLEYRRQAEAFVHELELWNQTGHRKTGIAISKVETPNFSKHRELFRTFFLSRRSIRDFSPELPPQEDIEEAIEWALNSPSVCNRQAWKVWLIKDPSKLHQVRNLQNGNAGFSNLHTMLVIGVDRRMFTLGLERNQLWVDGGMFAMSLSWSLHSKNIGSCFLNWAESTQKTEALRRLLSVSEEYEFVTLCAIGITSDDCFAPISKKKTLQQGLVVV